MNTVRLNTANDDKVVVRKTSGGGSSGGSSAIEYLDVSGVASRKITLCMLASLLCKYTREGKTEISNSGTAVSNLESNFPSGILAIAVDFSIKLYSEGTLITVKDALVSVGWNEEKLASIPRITEEEFYSI